MYDYYTTTANYYDSYSTAAGVGAASFGVGMLIVLGILILICLAVTVFQIFALAKLFKKAGKPGWAAIVPVYNVLVLLEIIGYNWYYIFVYCASIIPVVGSAVVLLFGITQNIKLSKSFGQSVGYGIGLWLLPIVFVPIIAFNKNINYVGPAVNKDIDFNDLF